MKLTLPTQFIQQEISVSGQVATAIWVFVRSKFKVRLLIKSDSVDRQSTARAFVFQPDKLQWAEIASIPHTEMGTMHGIAYSRDVKHAGNYAKDFQALLGMVDAILDVSPADLVQG